MFRIVTMCYGSETPPSPPSPRPRPNLFGHTVQFFLSDTISIRTPWENCFAVPNQQLPLVYGGAGA